MMQGHLILLGLAAGASFVLSALLAGAVLRYSLAHEVLDVPNERSSHDRPTPRGGGLAIALVVLGGVAVAAAAGQVPADVAWALVGGGSLVAVVGWVDDHGGLAARWRFAVHLAAAGWAVYWIGGPTTLALGSIALPLGVAGHLLAVIGTVWLINLYNFMDGIDGIAGGEAAVVATIGAVLLVLEGRPELALPSVLIAASALGFLVWNWSPARIFMGDVGSGMLGFLFAVLSLASDRAGAVPLLVWVALLGVFVVDATATLLRRIAQGECWYAAHRSHAYQRLVQAGWSHAGVSTGVIALSAGVGGLILATWAWPRALPAAVGCGLGAVAAAYLWVEAVRPMWSRPHLSTSTGRRGRKAERTCP